MPDPMDWLLETLDPELHHDVQALAAQAGVSTQEISARLLRLGMVTPELYRSASEAAAGCPWCEGTEVSHLQTVTVSRHGPDGEAMPYPEQEQVQCQWCYDLRATLAAYDAALNPEGDPDD